jgi:ubiquinone/menaquinone biosynthesis C-methylase UbiE
MSSVKRVRDVFDDWARRGRAEGMERTHGPVARQVFDRLGVRPGSRYLDIGCGSGYTVRWAAAVAPDVQALGVDVSSTMIEQARAASAVLANARFRCGAFPMSGLEDASFDAIFSMEVFYYLDDLDAGLHEVRRLLAPGGRFACAVDYYEENPESHSWTEDLGLALQLLSEAGWAAAFERAGLTVLEQARLRAVDREATPAGAHGASLLTLGARPA